MITKPWGPRCGSRQGIWKGARAPLPASSPWRRSRENNEADEGVRAPLFSFELGQLRNAPMPNPALWRDRENHGHCRSRELRLRHRAVIGTDEKNIPPTIHPSFSPTMNLKPGDSITFKVRTFRDQGGETWNFDDGTPPVKVQSDGNAKALARDAYATTHRAFAKQVITL